MRDCSTPPNARVQLRMSAKAANADSAFILRAYDRGVPIQLQLVRTRRCSGGLCVAKFLQLHCRTVRRSAAFAKVTACQVDCRYRTPQGPEVTDSSIPARHRSPVWSRAAPDAARAIASRVHASIRSR